MALSPYRVLALLVAALAALYILTYSSIGVVIRSAELGTEANVYLAPDQPCSFQPVAVWVQGFLDDDVIVRFSIRVEAVLDPEIPGVTLPPPLEFTYESSLPALALEGGYRVAFVPGLPAETITVRWVDPIRGEVESTLNITSTLAYRVERSGEVLEEGSIRWLPCPYTPSRKPFVYVTPLETLSHPGFLEETLGLSTPWWTVSQAKPVDLFILALDDLGVEEAFLEYSVSGSQPARVDIEELEASMKAGEAAEKVNMFLDSVEGEVSKVDPGFELPRTHKPFLAGIASIDGLEAGVYVEFWSRARDVEGNESRSPKGVYYVAMYGQPKVLIVDPSLRLWLLRVNAEELKEASRSIAPFAPSQLADRIKIASEAAARLSEAAIPRFHYWNRLGAGYEVRVATLAYFQLPEVLSSYKPSTVVLSNMVMGVEELSELDLDWDLRAAEAFEALRGYLRGANAGLIVTHGTLFDEIVWIDCNTKVRVGPRGHVGYTLEDLDPLRERTLVSMLGLPELTLWEVVRDYTAEALCASGDDTLEALGVIVGSLPILVPYVPFSGEMEATSYARQLGWDIPERFTVNVEGWEDLGFKAYTLVGWQMAFPETLASQALEAAGESRRDVEALYSRLASALQVLGARDVSLALPASKSLEWGLKEFWDALASASIEGGTLRFSVEAPGADVFEGELGLTEDAMQALASTLPPRLIAVSSDGMAAIIAFDRFWDPQGYRSVLFTFEVEAVEGEIGGVLLREAVKWVSSWSYRDDALFLGPLLVPRQVYMEFIELEESLRSGGAYIVGDDLVMLNERGSTLLELYMTSDNMYLIIAHPTTDTVEVELAEGDATVKVKNGNGVTLIELEGNPGSRVVLSMKASSQKGLNQAYIRVFSESTTITVTSTETITTTITETETETTTETVTTVTTETITETTQITVTETTTQSYTLTETVTTTTSIVETVTETIVETDTETVTLESTVTQTVTSTVVRTVESTVTTTLEKTLTTEYTTTITEVETETVTRIQTGGAAALAAVGLLIGAVVGFIASRLAGR